MEQEKLEHLVQAETPKPTGLWGCDNKMMLKVHLKTEKNILQPAWLLVDLKIRTGAIAKRWVKVLKDTGHFLDVILGLQHGLWPLHIQFLMGTHFL